MSIIDDLEKVIHESGKQLKVIAEETGIPYSSLLKMKKKKEYRSSVIDKILLYLNFKMILLKNDKSLKEQLKKEIANIIDEYIK